MKAEEESRSHQAREKRLASTLARCRKEYGRRVPPRPARGDGQGQPWRPGER